MYRNIVPSAVTQRVVTAFRPKLQPACEEIARHGMPVVFPDRQPDPGVGHPVSGRRVHRGAAVLDGRPARDRAAVRTVVLAMIGLTLLVIAMIASYSGALAKPTLHHMTVAVAAPEQVVNGVRGQEALAVNEVGDDAAARRQVYERKSDAAFVVSPTGEMKIYVAGGGGRSVANAAETVGRAVAAEAGLTPAVEDVAPASAGDPSGTVEFYAIIFISIGASVGATMLGRLMGTVRRPPTLALRSATLAGYSALLSVAVTVYVDVILGALTAHTWQVFGALWLYAMAVGGVVTGAGRGIRLGCIDESDGVPLFGIHRNRASGFRCLVAAQPLLLRRQRRADAACHDGDLGSCGLFARNRRHRFASELSCHL